MMRPREMMEMSSSDDEEEEQEGNQSMDEDEKEELKLFRGRQPPKKRIKRRKEQAMLGVFASDESDNDGAFSRKTMRHRGVTFGRASTLNSTTSRAQNGASTKHGHTMASQPAATSSQFGGFGAKMLARMGHVEGRGLGAKGQGIASPVEARTRAGRVGIGVDLKSNREKDNESGTDPEKVHGARPKARKPKQVFRTAEEITGQADGLQVPSVLQKIVDMRGKETRFLESLEQAVDAADVVNKLADMARRDLEFYVNEWKQIHDRKQYVDIETDRLSLQSQEQSQEVSELEELHEAVAILSKKESIGTLLEELERVKIHYDSQPLDEIAVAAIYPKFRAAMQSWEPDEHPAFYVDELIRLQKLLMQPMVHETPRTNSFESMLHALWLPKVRSFLNNDWQVHDPAPALNLIEAWRPVLPPFIYSAVTNHVILPKLHTAIMEWNPRRRGPTTLPPHTWIFPWLPYLGDHEWRVIGDVKHKMGRVLDVWDISRGQIEGLDKWTEVFGAKEMESLLVRRLLPRLALFLRNDFEIDPADQKLESFKKVLQWRTYFRPAVFAHLFESEFFVKWLAVLHLWLTNSPNYEEVNMWYEWWKRQIPEDLASTAPVKEGFTQGLEMMNSALDLGADASVRLPLPVAGPARPFTEASPSPPAAPVDAPKTAVEATSKDVIEDWCAEQGLLFIPLRKAEQVTGRPLYRITASAAGTGGIVCYLESEVIWCQTKDRSRYEPLGLEEVLARTHV